MPARRTTRALSAETELNLARASGAFPCPNFACRCAFPNGGALSALSRLGMAVVHRMQHKGSGRPAFRRRGALFLGQLSVGCTRTCAALRERAPASTYVTTCARGGQFPLGLIRQAPRTSCIGYSRGEQRGWLFIRNSRSDSFSLVTAAPTASARRVLEYELRTDYFRSAGLWDPSHSRKVHDAFVTRVSVRLDRARITRFGGVLRRSSAAG
jgi:hypothetical protein